MLLVYVTCPNFQEATELAKICVQERLAACANIVPSMRSVYIWEGDMKIEEESLLLLKCSENNWIALEKLIIKNHPYDVPCLVAYRSSHAYGPFEKWVDESHR